MTWKDFLKPKAAPLKADGRLRWFGKLPTYADYYASPADADWAVEFNDWVLNGFARYHARQKEAGHRIPRMDPRMCILRLPKSGMTVLSLFDDYGGDMQGRPFPIVFYVAVPSAGWPGPAAAGFCTVRDICDAFLRLRGEIAGFFNSPARFEAIFGDRELDVSTLEGTGADNDWMAPLAQFTLAEWYDATRDGASETALAEWAGDVRRIGEAVARQVDEDGFEPTFLFPLAKGTAVDSQVAAWLSWLGSRMDLGSRFLSLMWPLDSRESAGRLAAVARPLVLDDFLLMTPLADRLSYVENLVRAGQASREGTAPDSPTATGADDELTWLDFLTRG